MAAFRCTRTLFNPTEHWNARPRVCVAKQFLLQLEDIRILGVDLRQGRLGAFGNILLTATLLLPLPLFATLPCQLRCRLRYVS